MLNIKMESNVRNYLIRLLEKEKENLLRDKNATKEQQQYDLKILSIAGSRLMGYEPSIALGKQTETINFGYMEDKDGNQRFR